MPSTKHIHNTNNCFSISYSSLKIYFTRILIFNVFILGYGLSQKAYTQNIDKALHMAYITAYNDNFQKGMNETNYLLSQAQKKGNIPNILQALIAKSNLFTINAELPRALRIADTAISMGKANKLKKETALAYLSRAEAQFWTNELTKAYMNCDSAENIMKEEPDDLTREKLSIIRYNIFTILQDTNKINFYTKEAIHYAKNLELNLQMNAQLMQLSSDIRFSGRKDPKYLYKILKGFNNIISTYKQHPNEVTKGHYIVSTINILDIQNRFPSAYKDPKAKARAYQTIAELKSALTNIPLTGNIFWGFAYIQRYNLTDDEDEKIKLLKISLEYFKKDSIGKSFPQIVEISQAIGEYYAGKKEYQTAYNYQQLCNTYTKRQEATEIRNNIAKFQIATIDLNRQSDLSKLHLRIRIYIALLIIAILAIVAILQLLKSKSLKLKISKSRQEKITQEREQMALKAQLAQEEKSRIEIEQKLLATQKEQLTKEVLSNELLLQHKNSLLKDLHDKIKDGENIDIHKVVKQEMLLDEDFENTKAIIQNIHPDFFNKLMQTANHKLTSLDLKYAAYIHLNVGTRQIANTLNVETQSVRMTKYRLKQKLGLDKDTDLETFIRELH